MLKVHMIYDLLTLEVTKFDLEGNFEAGILFRERDGKRGWLALEVAKIDVMRHGSSTEH